MKSQLDSPMIRVEGLTKRYPGAQRPALEDVSLTVDRSEFLAVIGRSGSGKTTLLNILGGLDRDCSGLVEVDGKVLALLHDRELSRLRNQCIGFVFQAFNLLPHLSILENVMLPASFGPASSDALARAEEALSRVGLLDKADVPPTRLSAGEKQRVAIARAILNRPKLLLCDEPTGNLDKETGQTVIEIFRELNGRDHVTLVIATHEMRVAEAASRCIELAAGRLVQRRGEGRA